MRAQVSRVPSQSLKTRASLRDFFGQHITKVDLANKIALEFQWSGDLREIDDHIKGLLSKALVFFTNTPTHVEVLNPLLHIAQCACWWRHAQATAYTQHWRRFTGPVRQLSAELINILPKKNPWD